VEIKTEDITLENSIIYSIFKFGETALNAVKKYIGLKDFVISTNKKILKIIFDNFDKNKKIPSVKGTYKYFCSQDGISDEDRLAVKYALEKIAESSIEEKDIPLFCQKLKVIACQRHFVKKVKWSLDEIRLDNFNDVLVDFSRELIDIRQRMDDDLEKNTMFFKRDIDKRLKYYQEISEDEIKAGLIYTGFNNFDRFMPALGRGTLGIYQARVNVGKSMALMHTALHNYSRGMKVIIVTIEMPALEYCMRMDAKVSKILHSHFSKGRIFKDETLQTHWKEKVQNFAIMNSEDIAVYWVPGGCTPDKIEMIIATNPFKPDLVLIDYAGDMEAQVGGIPEFTPQAQAYIFMKLKHLAGIYNCVIYTAQQIKRGVKKIDNESGAMTAVAINKADLVVSIEESRIDSCDEGYKENTTKGEKKESDEEKQDNTHDGKLTLTVLKNRNATKFMITRVVKRFAKMTMLDEPEREFILYSNGDIEYPGKKTEESEELVGQNMESVLEEDKNLVGLL